MEIIKDMWSFLKERKKFWLIPAIVTLIIVGALIIFSANLAIAPFIYTIF
jgi:competence protein ComGC